MVIHEMMEQCQIDAVDPVDLTWQAYFGED
jgi:hypothetical protein